jgi:hypothetical protein
MANASTHLLDENGKRNVRAAIVEAEIAEERKWIAFEETGDADQLLKIFDLHERQISLKQFLEENG